MKNRASNNPPRLEPCSPAMGRVLANLYRGNNPWQHLSGRSMFGAAGQTERALIARGWCYLETGRLKLTPLGRERAADLV